jgi:hypothetical protein
VGVVGHPRVAEGAHEDGVGLIAEQAKGVVGQAHALGEPAVGAQIEVRDAEF